MENPYESPKSPQLGPPVKASRRTRRFPSPIETAIVACIVWEVMGLALPSQVIDSIGERIAPQFLPKGSGLVLLFAGTLLLSALLGVIHAISLLIVTGERSRRLTGMVFLVLAVVGPAVASLVIVAR
jgi:hypothetical protein